MQYKIINDIIFSESELEDPERVKLVMKEAKKLQSRPKLLATRKGILAKMKLYHDIGFIERLVRLQIGRTADHIGVRYRRYSKLLYSGKDLHYLNKLYRNK